ncbi:hypothetical protein ABZ896_42740 [Streptomyces sp. NPDC047072]|uniref:hypothetical protein n=1 Tax=Streptomyces sp. NPDC047072 TaxID=3154809 RepID=UPI0033EF7D1E
MKLDVTARSALECDPVRSPSRAATAASTAGEVEDAVTITDTSLSTILLADTQTGAVAPGGGWSLRTALG